jgi:hypothetical protein
MAVTFDFAHCPVPEPSLPQTFAGRRRSRHQVERNFRYEIPDFTHETLSRGLIYRFF